MAFLWLLVAFLGCVAAGYGPEYGVPSPPASEYGVPPPPASEYGVPPPPASEYGVPPPPASEYGAPPPPASAPPPPASESGVPLPPPPPASESGVSLPPPPIAELPAPPAPESNIPPPQAAPEPAVLQPATLAITSSASTLFYGSYPTFTITATGVEGSPLPTGKVDITYIYYNAPGHIFQQGVAAKVDLTEGQINYKPDDLSLGSGKYVYTVTYEGDAVYEAGATATLEQIALPKLVPNPKVTSSLNPSVYNSHPPTFTLSITSLEPQNPPIYATGTVTIQYVFYNSPGNVFQKGSETQTLGAQGQVQWVPSSLGLGGGVYQYTISYPGDVSYQTGGTSYTQTVVGRAVPAPSFTSSDPAPWYGSNPTLTFTVVPLGSTNYNYPPASGTVKIQYSYYNSPGHLFSQGVESNQVLTNGKVSWTSSVFNLGSGDYNFTASYPGDDFYQSGGTIFAQKVKAKLVPNPKVTSSLNPSVYNSHPPTFTLSIPSLVPQTPPVYATGQVTVAYTFYNSPGNVFQKGSETRTLGAGGQVSWVPPSLGLGSGVYEFTFGYAGDVAYQTGGTSFTQTVQGRAIPAPSLVSSANSFTYYINIPTYTLTINSLSPNNGFPKPSGQVVIGYTFYFPPGKVFSKGTESVQTLVDGKVSWIPQCFRLGSGTYVMTASYPGDDYYQSGGTSINQTVIPGGFREKRDKHEKRAKEHKKDTHVLAP